MHSEPSSTQPEARDAQIARIDALTASGRTNWFALLAYLAFVTVTTLGVEHVDFFVDSRQTQLPIVGVSIPTLSFFIFAPVLGAALYVHLHLHIRKVTEALGKPLLGPPPLLDGTPIETHIKPWLLNDFVLRQRRDGAVHARPLDTLSWLTTWALVWLAGPFVLGLMWVWGWPAHNLSISAINALCLMVAIYTGALSWTKMRSDTGRRKTPGVFFTTAMCGLLCLPVAWLTTANSKGIAEWAIAYDKDADDSTRTWVERQEAWVRNKADDPERTIYDKIIIWSWDNGTELAQLDSPDLTEARLSVLPPEHADLDTARHRYRAQWCQRYGFPPTICGGNTVDSDDAKEALWQARQTWCDEIGLTDCRAYFVDLETDFNTREWPAYRSSMLAAIDKPNLAGKDLRAARLNGAELSGTDLRATNFEGAILEDASLEGANLGGANLEGAYLGGANLQRANFESANLQGASLYKANLEGAKLRSANLQGASLSFANLQGANFWEANLQGAGLRSANLEGARLWEANLQGANLHKANLKRAELNEAKLKRSRLWDANLEGARLLGANLEGANLLNANLEGANLGGANLEGAILEGANLEGANLGGANLEGAYLFGANLKGANLERANLERALLVSANLEGAILEGANLEGALLFGAN
ncbi:MAG: pentapeptide repeat-containing protein [Donghicola eburneus]|nr:pentapeptide repeat-containing protein [Donghicola eburneus]MCI5041294.1 pentapeptide repeat-containing protein [Donghicola eburneus]